MHPSEEPLSRERSLKNYRREQLKKGGQGTVYKYTHPPTGNIYAVKVMEYDYNDLNGDGNPSNMIYMERESHASPIFQHAHLLRAHAVFPYEEGFAIIMPYFPRGSLRGMRLSPNEIKDAIRQILEALRHLHERNVFHRDIKPDNILVRNQAGEPLDLVVADYGLISLEKPISFVGTPRYTAPEIVRNRGVERDECVQYSSEVDIYALGMLLLEILGVSMSKPLIASREMFDRHVSAPLDEELDGCDPEDVERHDALSIAKSMIQFDPMSRPSVDECLRLPWLSVPSETRYPGQLATVPSNFSAIIPLAELSVEEPDITWWHGTPEAIAPVKQVQRSSTSGRYPRRKRKHTERYSPISAPHRYKIRKTSYKSLPTPRPTPEKVEKPWKSEAAQPSEPFRPQTQRTAPNEVSLKTEEKTSKESSGLLSWDDSKMEP